MAKEVLRPSLGAKQPEMSVILNSLAKFSLNKSKSRKELPISSSLDAEMLTMVNPHPSTVQNQNQRKNRA